MLPTPNPFASDKGIRVGKTRIPDSSINGILMKSCSQSRGPSDSLSAGPSNGISTETIETVQNKTEETNGANGSGTIETIDPTDASYFIQYQPELAAKLSQHQSKHSVSGRCLSIVLSRMIFWSRYSKHKYNGKLYYYKNQTELSEETGFSIKTINRALKVLVELGLIIRNKFLKHRYYQCYFYHIPLSPFTKEIKTTRTSTTRSVRNGSSNRSGGRHQQQFHSRSAAPEGAAAYYPAAAAQVLMAGAAAVPNASGGAGSGAAPAPAANSKTTTTSTINKGNGFGRNGRNCPIHIKKTTSNKKNTLDEIIAKCISYGNEDIYKEKFSWAISD